MYWFCLYIMAARRQQWIPFWVSLPTASDQLLSPTERQQKKNNFSFSLLILLKPFDGNLGQPLSQRLPGVGYAHPTKPCRWRGKRFHCGGGVCELCVSGVSLAKSLPSGSSHSFWNKLSSYAVKIAWLHVNHELENSRTQAQKSRNIAGSSSLSTASVFL